MRNRISFLAGFAVGFVAGARAGRERYEQMVKLGRQAVEHPAVQRATRTAGSKAGDLTKAAGQKAAEHLPKLTETARSSATKARTGASKARSSAGKVRGQLNRTQGRNSHDEGPTAGNGSRPGE